MERLEPTAYQVSAAVEPFDELRGGYWNRLQYHVLVIRRDMSFSTPKGCSSVKMDGRVVSLALRE